MRKGFTLVELAIVIVIIGILMGLAYKGRELIHLAQLNGAVSQLNTLQTALNSYWDKYQGSPPVANGTMQAALVGERELVDADFNNAMLSDSSTAIRVGHCVEANDGTLTISDAVSQNPSVCAGPVNGITFSAEYICAVEARLDDSDLITGNGRLRTGETYTMNDFADCVAYRGDQRGYVYILR